MAHQDTDAGKQPFLPESLQRLLRRRAFEIGGGLVGLAGLFLFLSIISFNPADPSLNRAVDGPVSNLMGETGAFLADFMLQTMGLASLFSCGLLLAWGWRLATGPRMGQMWLRVAAAMGLMLSAATALAALPRPDAWPLGAGLGGIAGMITLDRCAGLFRALFGEFGVVLVALLALVAAVFLLLYSLDLKMRELRERDWKVWLNRELDKGAELGKSLVWRASDGLTRLQQIWQDSRSGKGRKPRDAGPDMASRRSSNGGLDAELDAALTSAPGWAQLDRAETVNLDSRMEPGVFSPLLDKADRRHQAEEEARLRQENGTREEPGSGPAPQARQREEQPENRPDMAKPRGHSTADLPFLDPEEVRARKIPGIDDQDDGETASVSGAEDASGYEAAAEMLSGARSRPRQPLTPAFDAENPAPQAPRPLDADSYSSLMAPEASLQPPLPPQPETGPADALLRPEPSMDDLREGPDPARHSAAFRDYPEQLAGDGRFDREALPPMPDGGDDILTRELLPLLGGRDTAPEPARPVSRGTAAPAGEYDTAGPGTDPNQVRAEAVPEPVSAPTGEPRGESFAETGLSEDEKSARSRAAARLQAREDRYRESRRAELRQAPPSAIHADPEQIDDREEALSETLLSEEPLSEAPCPEEPRPEAPRYVFDRASGAMKPLSSLQKKEPVAELPDLEPIQAEREMLPESVEPERGDIDAVEPVSVQEAPEEAFAEDEDLYEDQASGDDETGDGWQDPDTDQAWQAEADEVEDDLNGFESGYDEDRYDNGEEDGPQESASFARDGEPDYERLDAIMQADLAQFAAESHQGEAIPAGQDDYIAEDAPPSAPQDYSAGSYDDPADVAEDRNDDYAPRRSDIQDVNDDPEQRAGWSEEEENRPAISEHQAPPQQTSFAPVREQVPVPSPAPATPPAASVASGRPAAEPVRRDAGIPESSRTEPARMPEDSGEERPLRAKVILQDPAESSADPKAFGGEVPEEFDIPPLDLLTQAPENAGRYQGTELMFAERARELESVLNDFGVRGEIVKVRPGPVVTLYELAPAPGTKSSRVISLADDIARSMSAISVRIAVVPGRNVIGIELPNKEREMVALRQMLSGRAFRDDGLKLPLALGKDIAGAPIIADLARMPHLLVAGTTGSGKSVAINAMILSLIYRLAPRECRFIMIDPKMLELSVYNDIPHLLSPVVTDPSKAVVALKWAVREMEDRYKKMSILGVRNIDSYNLRITEARENDEYLVRKVQTGFDRETGKPIYEEQPLGLENLPYIVVVVDEMADLMLVAGKDIEAAIQRLAQMARAAGIHLIMATQRPSVDVITGTIKANFPTRISFAVTSKIDSRTILGEPGAEQLLGQGDMLYMAGGGRITRVHGPFVSDREVEKVVEYLKGQAGPAYIEGLTDDVEDFGEEEESGGSGSSRGKTGEEDALYDEALAIVTRERKASTSFVQRQLQIGYNRAARIIESMEANGVVSAPNRVGKREVLAPPPRALPGEDDEASGEVQG